MFSNKLVQASVAITIISALTACNSGGGDTAGGALDVTSSGTITGFGSVFVNGVRYETENARIISADDDSVILENPTNAQLQAVLGVGQIITVRGSRTDDSNGVANTIRFDDELVGEITTVSTADGTFTVLGQTVSVTPDTIIDDSIIEAARGGAEVPDDLRFGDISPETLDDLFSANTGMFVSVSGFPSQNGLEATRVEDVSNLVGAGGGQLEAEVKGFVAKLDENPGEFEINGLTVSYDAGDLDAEDFGNLSLANGQFVEVHGTATSSTTVDASRIELEDDFVDDDFNSGEIEIEGVIQKVAPGVIVINGIEIRVNDVTPFSEGLRVEIKGTLQSDGSIVITRLHDESEDTVRTEDIAVSADATSFTTRLGLVITPSDRSRLEDDTINDDDNLSIDAFLNNIVPNSSRIEARGFPLNGDTAWTRLEIEDSNDQDCRLRGPVASINGTSSFSIEGVNIDVSQVSDNNFEGPDGQSIGRAAFFNQLNTGDVVQATSDQAGSGCSDGNLVAREVEFEPENDVFVGGGNGGVNDNQINGTVSAVTADTLTVSGQTITVNNSTLIDDSIIEAARGVEIDNDQPLGSLPESLQELLPVGLLVEVGVDRSSGVVAIYIEDM